MNETPDAYYKIPGFAYESPIGECCAECQQPIKQVECITCYGECFYWEDGFQKVCLMCNGVGAKQSCETESCKTGIIHAVIFNQEHAEAYLANLREMFKRYEAKERKKR